MLWSVLGLAFVLALVGIYWYTRPPRIVIPERQYPPGNVYEQLKNTAMRFSRTLSANREHKEIVSTQLEITRSQYEQLIQKYQPFIDEYSVLLDKPCVAVYEYDLEWLFPEFSSFRELARLESVLMRYELRNGREKEAAQRLDRVVRLGNQTRNGGFLIHYLVGKAIIFIGLDPVLEHGVHQPDALQGVVNSVQHYIDHPVSLSDIYENERRFSIAGYRMYQREPWTEFWNRVQGDMSLPDAIRARLTLRAGYEELHAYHTAFLAELRKPLWEQDFSRLPVLVHPLNKGFALLTPNTVATEEVAMVKLLGVLSAVRLYKHRTGRYPERLEDLHLGEMIIDPYTGKPFVYRVDPVKGFQLYSLGPNKQDDGGSFPVVRGQGALVGADDIVPYVVPRNQRAKGEGMAHPPVWFR